MHVPQIATGIWFILVGVAWLGWISIDIRFIGLLAFVLGIIWLVDSIEPKWWAR